MRRPPRAAKSGCDTTWFGRRPPRYWSQALAHPTTDCHRGETSGEGKRPVETADIARVRDHDAVAPPMQQASRRLAEGGGVGAGPKAECQLCRRARAGAQ